VRQGNVALTASPCPVMGCSGTYTLRTALDGSGHCTPSSLVTTVHMRHDDTSNRDLTYRQGMFDAVEIFTRSARGAFRTQEPKPCPHPAFVFPSAASNGITKHRRQACSWCLFQTLKPHRPSHRKCATVQYSHSTLPSLLTNASNGFPPSEATLL